MLKLKYTDNETLWAIEYEAEKHGYNKTSDCYWAQIFTDAAGNEMHVERDEDYEGDALQVLAGYFNEADNNDILAVFVNTWGNYNDNGADGGQWVTLPMDADALRGTLQRIADNIGDNDAEFCIHDVDNDSGIDFDIGEHDNIFELNERLQAVADLDKWDRETYAAACEYWGSDYVDIENIDDYNLYTDVYNEYDLGKHYATEVYFDLFRKDDTILSRDFDFEAFGRDIASETDGGFTEYGFIEKN